MLVAAAKTVVLADNSGSCKSALGCSSCHAQVFHYFGYWP